MSPDSALPRPTPPGALARTLSPITCALILTGLAAVLRLAAEPWLAGRVPFHFFYPAVLLAAWLKGPRAGALATALGGAAGVALMASRFSWSDHAVENTASLISYLLTAGLVCGLAGALAGAQSRALEEARARAESEERLAVTLGSIGDAVIATDVRGRVTFINTVAEELTGWTAAHALGRDAREVFRIINEHTRHPVESPIARVLKEGVIVGLANHTVLLARDGKERPIDDSGSPIRTREGEVIGSVLIFRDISPRRAAEDQLASLNHRLTRAMAETHHRVKNNLQVIAALIDLQILEGADTIPISEMRRLGQHVSALAAIHDLLTRESVPTGAVEYIGAREAITRLVPLLQNLVADGRRLNVSVEDLRLPMRQGTAIAVLMNELVSNASKHGAGDIDLTLSVVQDRARLEVADRGEGFPVAFDSRENANTGLELIEQLSRWDLSGEVTYANREEGGACVRIEFPIPG